METTNEHLEHAFNNNFYILDQIEELRQENLAIQDEIRPDHCSSAIRLNGTSEPPLNADDALASIDIWP